jgi:excisionase family DNA binding protein
MSYHTQPSISDTRPPDPTTPATRLPIQSLSPRLITTRDVAHLLGCSPRHVGRLIARGELEIIGQGRGLRIVFDSVDAFINRRKVVRAPDTSA